MVWFDVCGAADLQPDSGICALVQDQQIAVFYFANSQKVYAISNFDPFGQANVLSRGLIGDISGQAVVASPLYKQHFNLETGQCLEDAAVQIPAYTAQIVNGRVQISW
ncbi:MAG: nitrite reductase small subunit NirD [Methylovulum sp.]|uniref:nitrite reductase small subunit NirD n=1 Tax=Methylovulum sp. TaxID=1916980 RepID=UPI00262B4C37|nr:nitrite reductase small subunit NirD [Methylovulum sp.]MDD2723121.1 nitrite reductase small subunit NirD [Methylovulum sp.]MDD5124826.1 nitrite reductase small subunit NirD [Methylovulum sp.]